MRVCRAEASYNEKVIEADFKMQVVHQLATIVRMVLCIFARSAAMGVVVGMIPPSQHSIRMVISRYVKC